MCQERLDDLSVEEAAHQGQNPHLTLSPCLQCVVNLYLKGKVVPVQESYMVSQASPVVDIGDHLGADNFLLDVQLGPVGYLDVYFDLSCSQVYYDICVCNDCILPLPMLALPAPGQ